MLARYARPAMLDLWGAQTRYRLLFEIEAHAAEAMARAGLVPAEAIATIWARGRGATFDEARIAAIEAEVKHDLIAFLTHLGEIVGPEARHLHLGLTSSDVLDAAFAVQMARAIDLLVAATDRLLAALRARAHEHRLTPTIGRSHGMHAEPTTFGLKLAFAFAEFARHRERLLAARREIAVCSLSGAVGTYATVDPAVEAHVAAAMGLSPETIATQVVPRDRHAMAFATFGVVAGSIERLAVEIRHLQRSEVGEAEEPFAKGQKGSSAMPHKRNPILSENLTGLARMVRAQVLPALENVALWHERDISHSSVERFIAPDATTTLDFALHRLAGLVEGLVIKPDRMAANLASAKGLHASQRVLLALVEAGLSREAAYALVQRAAMAAIEGGGQFLDRLKEEGEVTRRIPLSSLDALFDLEHYMKHVDTIFARVFAEGEDARGP
jgi:adenylosuccinate lyase